MLVSRRKCYEMSIRLTANADGLMKYQVELISVAEPHPDRSR